MGKRNLERITQLYGSNETNLNGVDTFRVAVKEQKAKAKAVRYKTRRLHNMMTGFKLHKRKHPKKYHYSDYYPFGYWRQWFYQGKIGLEEQTSPEKAKVIKVQ